MCPPLPWWTHPSHRVTQPNRCAEFRAYELGAGWGHITVLHFLTDLGLACKPDLHLVRTVRHLGMSLDLRNAKVPNLTDSIIINTRVRELLRLIDGEVRPARLRYLDKVLMDISYYDVI